MDGEVGASQHHPRCDRQLDSPGVEVCQGVGVGREPAGRDGAERVVDRVEGSHPDQVQDDDTTQRKAAVYEG